MARASQLFRVVVLPVLVVLLLRAIYYQPTHVARRSVFAKLAAAVPPPRDSVAVDVRRFWEEVRPEARPVVAQEGSKPGVAQQEVRQPSPPREGCDLSSSECEAAECRRLESEHRVVPGSSWGTLPAPLRSRWTELGCDARVSVSSPAKVPAASRAKRKECGESNGPLIAVCCGTTTRKKGGGWVDVSELETLALFKHLLPSFAKSVDCEFSYVVVVGYDVGDAWWDTGGGAAEATAWFERNAPKNARLEFARVHNKIKKPGPVFSAITQKAFELGAEYIYRVNDDTELETPWATAFVAALETLDNVGVVGPACKQGNRKILTHDFTHRTHMNIFHAVYYPPALSDWWMDDWISTVYGPQRTLRGDNVEVIHHTQHHGQRYGVDKAHHSLLPGLLRTGTARIQAHLLAASKPTLPVAPPPPGFSRLDPTKPPRRRRPKPANRQL
ncbi:hypothetical protein CTAYLR_005387 [Chrysophaeum taylorii]|uniref:Uncharacterized protein n=1 Tax=Chrysophaeum taylorii TaxID=2483200 RepID=A0AAD7U7D4_9STRA|nr:hypothetical protein CTAYLR_005387 [Chrysophaeum taylorii]